MPKYYLPGAATVLGTGWYWDLVIDLQLRLVTGYLKPSGQG